MMQTDLLLQSFLQSGGIIKDSPGDTNRGLKTPPRKQKIQLQQDEALQHLKEERNYMKWRGAQQFFCKGRLITGPKISYPILSFLLINIPSGLSIAFPLRVIFQEFNNYVKELSEYYNYSIMAMGILLQVLSTIFLILTACSEPGIIPSRVQLKYDEVKVLFDMQNILNNLQKVKYTDLQEQFTVMIVTVVFRNQIIIVLGLETVEQEQTVSYQTLQLQIGMAESWRLAMKESPYMGILSSNLLYFSILGEDILITQKKFTLSNKKIYFGIQEELLELQNLDQEKIYIEQKEHQVHQWDQILIKKSTINLMNLNSGHSHNNGFAEVSNFGNFVNRQLNKDLQLAEDESNMIVKPGEIHMNDDEMKNVMDPSCVTDNDEKLRRSSHRTGMEDNNSRSFYYPAIQVIFIVKYLQKMEIYDNSLMNNSKMLRQSEKLEQRKFINQNQKNKEMKNNDDQELVIDSDDEDSAQIFEDTHNQDGVLDESI
ncbi:UNKNOWN [Stylonychia lemnae]|uniref:Transmembrane protein n=1 Tax=Stylonychia lemnae TaxID=5949 RepID=A0A077ZYS7_STYLE|nr:UNKNOWN [Stylonychia lemnae]|eukprot:CDW75060.1 UNKNOWN [Stylonychia lemnae]